MHICLRAETGVTGRTCCVRDVWSRIGDLCTRGRSYLSSTVPSTGDREVDKPRVKCYQDFPIIG